MSQVTNQHEVDSKMDAICFSETSVDFERTTSHYIPDDRTRHNQRSEKKVLNRIIFRNNFLSWGVEYDEISNAIIRA
jgi:hypothetical protein